MAQPMPLVVIDRFWSNVTPIGPSACWLWTGSVDRSGYGKFRWKRNKNATHLGAHRAAYELLVGDIPAGLVIDHLCRNRVCVNPDHMEPVTNAENIRRGATGLHPHNRRAVTADGYPVCGNGHVLSPDNARPHHEFPGLAACIECGRERTRRSAARRSAA